MRHSQFLHEEIRVLRRYLTRHGMPERRGSLVVAEREERKSREAMMISDTRGETTRAIHHYSFASSGHAFRRNTPGERMSFPARCRMWNGPEAKTRLTLARTERRAQHKTQQQRWNSIDFNYMGVRRSFNLAIERLRRG